MRLNIGHLTSEGDKEPQGNTLTRKALLVYEGKFASMDGDVTLAKKDLEAISGQHNTLMERMKRLVGGHPKGQVPVQLDHSPKASDTIGRVIGPVEMGRFTDDDGVEKDALFGNVMFIGKDNVEKAQDGRYTHLSVGLDKNHKLTEVSVTPFPAAPNASLLSRLGTGEEDMSYSSMKEKMGKYAKCKKHLMDEKKMSDQDADKHLEAAKDEDVEKLAAEADEHEKKMKSKMSDDDGKKDKEELSKLRAELAAVKGDQEKVRLATRKVGIATRLATLQSQGKITPAEYKKIDIVRLASGTEETANEVLKTYEARQPVVDFSQRGTKKAVDPSEIGKEMKRLKSKQVEAEAVSNMPFLKAAKANEKKRLADGGAMPGGPTNPSKLSDEGGAMPGGETNPSHMAGYEGLEADYETMGRLMDEGQHEEAKKHFAGMKEKMKAHLAGDGGAAPMDQVQAHMKELEDSQMSLSKKLDLITH